VLQRSAKKRPRLTPVDRLLWLWLSRLWNDWRSVLVIVQPDTVLAWHRKGFCSLLRERTQAQQNILETNERFGDRQGGRPSAKPVTSRPPQHSRAYGREVKVSLHPELLGIGIDEHTAMVGAFFVSSETRVYFLGVIASLAALATRNLTTVLAGILIASPVCGLRPMRALRLAFTRRPRPGTTNTPFCFVSLIATSASESRNAAACLLLSSFFSAMWRTSWVLVMPVAIRKSSLKG